MIALVAFVLGFSAGWVAAAAALGRCPHAWTLQLSRSRIWLTCPLCGDESPGWELYDKRGA